MDAPELVRPAGGPLAPPLIATSFAAWSRTWRVRRHGFQAVEQARSRGPVVYAFWHGEQLAYIGTHRHLGVAGMASRSRDGELLARCIHRLGYALLRGSTSRGGKDAFLQALRALEGGLSPALAVDGPRGPLHQPHIGAVALAARAGVPVAWVVSRAAPRVRLGSWDRFEIPLALARLDLVYGLLPPSPDPEDRAGIEAARQELGRRMRAASAHLAAGGAPADCPLSG